MNYPYDDELEQRARVAACLKVLEEAVDRITPALGGIGHNQPPADDDDEGTRPQGASKPISPNILNTKQAADYVGLSPSTLAKLRLSGDGPVFIKMRSRVGYQLPFLDEWLVQRRRTSTSDAGLASPVSSRSSLLVTKTEAKDDEDEEAANARAS